ncbi:MAG: NAD(P)/FAD-dependent oxidoreductase [Rhodocyclaceae bacterium]|nr:NAD(P)/FAD-dependent oxidoreductase [Rhodocyclaceae bacterium]
MFLKRRRLLLASALGWSLARPAYVYCRETRAKIVIAGGGWGGMSVARQLVAHLPNAEVIVIERQARFWSCPLSNKWLVGLLDESLLLHDTATAAARHGWRFVNEEVIAIDRRHRRVFTKENVYAYDFLVIALGIRHDYAVWFGADVLAAQRCRQSFPPAWTAEAEEFFRLRRQLMDLQQGELLMTIPPSPYRCGPAPYERALLLAGWFAATKRPVRLTVIDANPPHPLLTRSLREWGEHLQYWPQTSIMAVDLDERIAFSEFDRFRFDHAILMPPQRAAGLVEEAGLAEKDAQGRSTGWAAADPVTFAARDDEHIFFVGDVLGKVSDTFGHYPKTAEIAVRQGALVAQQIAARLSGRSPPQGFPHGVCHLTTRYAPPQAMTFVSRFRRRGDGELVQESTTHRNPLPAGEDIGWLRALLGEIF